MRACFSATLSLWLLQTFSTRNWKLQRNLLKITPGCSVLKTESTDVKKTRCDRKSFQKKPVESSRNLQKLMFYSFPWTWANQQKWKNATGMAKGTSSASPRMPFLRAAPKTLNHMVSRIWVVFVMCTWCWPNPKSPYSRKFPRNFSLVSKLWDQPGFMAGFGFLSCKRVNFSHFSSLTKPNKPNQTNQQARTIKEW